MQLSPLNRDHTKEKQFHLSGIQLSIYKVYHVDRAAASIRRRSDYIIGFIAPAIVQTNPRNSHGLKRRHTICTRQSLNEKQHTLLITDDNCLSVKPCMLLFIQILPRILYAGAISRVSFLDLFGLIAGVIDPIM